MFGGNDSDGDDDGVGATAVTMVMMAVIVGSTWHCWRICRNLAIDLSSFVVVVAVVVVVVLLLFFLLLTLLWRVKGPQNLNLPNFTISQWPPCP